MANPSPTSETTGATNELTSVKLVNTLTMPLAPTTVRPPMISGSAAATTPPKMKKSRTATAGIASSSMRWMSPAIVDCSAPATA